MHIHFHNEPHSPYQIVTPADCAAAGLAEHRCSFGATPADFLTEAGSLEVLVAPASEMRALNLFAAPNLKLLQSTAAGVDALLPFHGIPPGVLLLNNRGTHAAKAGEFALMAILMLVNRMPFFASAQRAERWENQPCGLARDQRLTVVGLGSLGGAAAGQAKQLGMHITGIRSNAAAHAHCDRTLTLEALDEVLPETDILLLACPLTPATLNLLSARRIALLPKVAGVINIGRGGLIDEPALLDALEAGRLGGAILDVQQQEPLPPGHRAWRTKNLIITPHMSSDDPARYVSITLRIFKTNLNAYLSGKTPPTLVDPVKAY